MKIQICKERTKNAICRLPDNAVILEASDLVGAWGLLLQPPEYEVTYYIPVTEETPLRKPRH